MSAKVMEKKNGIVAEIPPRAWKKSRRGWTRGIHGWSQEHKFIIAKKEGNRVGTDHICKKKGSLEEGVPFGSKRSKKSARQI